MKLIKPLKNVAINNRFGPRQSFQLPDGQWTIPYHYGADFACHEGTPIVNSHDGTVIFSGHDHGNYKTEPLLTMSHVWGSPHIGGGNMVIVESGEWWFVYMHLVKPSKLRAGDRVFQGDLIGQVGTTGASNGNHLHQEVWRNGRPLNPELWYGRNLPGAKVFERKHVMKQSSYTLKKPLKIKGGARNRLPINAKGTFSIPSAKPTHATFGVYLTGNPGDTVQLIILKDTYINGKHIKSGAVRRVSLPIGHDGRGREQITAILTPETNIRYRAALQNDSKKDVTVTRTTLDRIEG